MIQKFNSFKWYQFGHQFLMIGLLGMVVYHHANIFLNQKGTNISTQSHNNDMPVHRLSTSDSNNSLDQVKNLQTDSQAFSRISSKRFSPSLKYITNISSRKETFVKNLLPAILVHNEQVLKDRKHLLILKKIKDAGKPLTSEQNCWLKQLAMNYKFDRITFSDLLKRVDIIPPSLALGQAVVETGWGGSIAAQQFNSPFGMMKTARMVYTYDSLQESVSHYIHNLNTHPAYVSMRTIRANLRSSGDSLCSLKLVNGMGRYSEIGQTYISRVKNIIQSFKLQHYDQVELMPHYQKL